MKTVMRQDRAGQERDKGTTGTAGKDEGVPAPSRVRRGFLLGRGGGGTHRGIEVGLHLRPGLPDENFVAQALGNLAAFELQEERAEALDWQVLRVDLPNSHHFRLVIRHPERVLDVGLEHGVRGRLDSLSNETVEQLRTRFAEAKGRGLKPTPLRHVQESVDYWRDDFWNWWG